ncbi:YeiH family protein [Gottfriedia solisilvae]|uniref:Membrane protein n=1 Tax=Gottfriedia solisilvae TaxID=1516104 RepID=A0A8J3ANA8_9BACI|nr:putative sulfate exporter family transporter [Gottfriedia solisilvae]GGI16930.1 membrane protein [Gottfriedia solisilvae]
MGKMKRILPGFILCLLIAIISQVLSFIIPVGAATFSILIGLMIGNTFGVKSNYQIGRKFAESTLLEVSIFLLGATVSVQMIHLLGFKGLLMIVIQMTLVLIFTIWIGKKLGFGINFSYLMASGNAVCGSSAIGATAPAIHATQEEKGLAVTIVNLMGTVLMFILPLIAAVLYHSETLPTAALLGSTLQSVGQVVASGSLVNDDVKNYATIFKLIRVIFLVAVVIILSNSKRKTMTDHTNEKLKVKFPWYVIGFAALCVLYSIGVLPSWLSNVSNQSSHLLEIIALAAIGLNVNIKYILQQGKKLSLYALLIVGFQILVAIMFIQVWY